MFTIKQDDKLAIRFSQILTQGDKSELEIYFVIPKEMGINTHTLKEEDFYHRAIKGKRTYYNRDHRLPFQASTEGEITGKDKNSYRLHLNLFTYQNCNAIELMLKEALACEEPQDFILKSEQLLNFCSELLARLRRSKPKSSSIAFYFDNANNYLSWFVEQNLLKLVALGPKSADFSVLRNQVLDYCRLEDLYRKDQKFNSKHTREEPNRIANKMRLLRRLVEQGIVLKDDTKSLGHLLKKSIKGITTGLTAMTAIVFILYLQQEYKGITATLLLSLAVVYGIREIFKEDFMNIIWRFVSKGRPKWSRTLSDTYNKKVIAKQLVWLEYIKRKKVPREIQELMVHRHRQNKVEEEILHYKNLSQIANKGFQTGYSQIKEQIAIDLRPFARYLERGNGQVFHSENGKVIKSSIEKRYQLNLVVASKINDQKHSLARYKITMNRSTIIEVEEIIPSK